MERIFSVSSSIYDMLYLNIFSIIMKLSNLNEYFIFEIIKKDVVSLQQMSYYSYVLKQ